MGCRGRSGVAEPVDLAAPDPTASVTPVPTLEASCHGDGWGALPALRLQELADDFRDDGSAGVSTCICSEDQNAELASCRYGLKDRMSSGVRTILARGRCLKMRPRFAATDAGPGVAQCAVTALAFENAPDAAADAATSGSPSVDEAVPTCDENSGTVCWRIVADRVNCPDSGFTLRIEGAQGSPESGTFKVECFR
jgi:hypothetical protein